MLQIKFFGTDVVFIRKVLFLLIINRQSFYEKICCITCYSLRFGSRGQFLQQKGMSGIFQDQFRAGWSEYLILLKHIIFTGYKQG